MSLPEPDFAEFSNPRLAAIYDALCPWGEAEDEFLRLAKALDPRTIIDFGCGTGNLALALAAHGFEVTGIEPAVPMLELARAKPGAGRVTWILGRTPELRERRADLILMTNHVAQFFGSDLAWRDLLEACATALHPGGTLIFDFRPRTDPPFPAWPRQESDAPLESTPLGPVAWWVTLPPHSGPHVRYRLHYRFHQTGEELISVNELTFRTPEEIKEALRTAGLDPGESLGETKTPDSGAPKRKSIYLARKTAHPNT